MVFTEEGGQWDTVRGRLGEAQELHSFIETRSQNSSAEAGAHEKENKHWSMVSQTVRFSHHFANRRGLRRGSIVTIAGMGGGSRRGSITLEASSSRRGSIPILSEASSMRRNSIAKRRGSRRGSIVTIAGMVGGSRRGSVTTHLVMAPAGLSVEEGRKVL
ncbi:hypothetical protein T484DRAFT_1923299, partial [Baffinella frigidus]